MVEYTKSWLPVDEQVARLRDRGVDIGDPVTAAQLLRRVGYYRLTGYLYPFKESAVIPDDDGRDRVLVFNRYRPGTTLTDAAQLIDFDRRLRMLVLDGVERIEVSLRMQIGYTLGEQSAYAYEDPSNFTSAFTAIAANPKTSQLVSEHSVWLTRATESQAASKEAFVEHFRAKYDGRMPIWALTEILELGPLGKLYQGMVSSLATPIADFYAAPTKKHMASWISAVNYVRNVAAHHAASSIASLWSPPAGHPRVLRYLCSIFVGKPRRKRRLASITPSR